ncbi:MAG TPA: NAD(P)/FAD-dependent oxidoreductase [Acidimicrobiales bacterium]|nr:NAD(P)/FAD-dependent oxidoreductase [Acidimicrobiales bacterium]
MPVSHPIEPITDDDEAIRAAVEFTDVPLLAALAQATGDRSVLRDDLRPDLSNPLDPMMGWTVDQLEAAKALAFETLSRWRDAGCPEAPHPSPEDLRAIMSFAVGGSVGDDYVPLLREELSAEGEDLRAPRWRRQDIDPERPFTVAIVGAGMSGLIAAHRLAQAGVPYVVLEKNHDVGGTWLENTYPGCRVDVANHLYSYSFAQKEDWPQHYSPQSELLSYFRTCAEDFDIRPNVRFRTEVTSAAFDDERCSWTLELATPDGPDRLEAQALIVAVGQLNRPKMPDIDGMSSFAGPSFHSARWDHDVDLRGKRVAVIGTGASAAQFVPIIAEQVSELLIFQRTPNWLVPIPHYHEEVPAGKRWLFRHVPSYNQWYRFWLFYRSADGLLPATEVDPDWTMEGSVGPMNALVRAFLASYLEGEFADDPAMLEKVLPKYPPASKRIILDNGAWPNALKRDNVSLITDRIDKITPTGVVTGQGEHEVDVIIYATGFLASHFLTPMAIKGRGGIDLHETWAGEARAYLGILFPGFPNLFCMYGPNTNIVVNGSIVYFSECEAHYILDCLRLLLEGHHGAIDVRRDVHDEFNVAIDEANRRRVWGVSNVNSWYKNASGRVTQNWPFTLQEYWRRTRRADPAELELLEPAVRQT